MLHELGAAITFKPNVGQVLASWNFDPAQSAMTVLTGLSLIDGTNMQTLVSTWYKDCEATWGHPICSAHRVDLHTQLRQLATQAEGPGRHCEVRERAKVVDYDAAGGRVTTEDGEVLAADLVVAADRVHSTAVRHVLDNDEEGGGRHVGGTGWAYMRRLFPTKELVSDPATAHMVQDSASRYFTAAGCTAGLVLYPCRK